MQKLNSLKKSIAKNKIQVQELLDQNKSNKSFSWNNDLLKELQSE